jgi:hypothetical protein
VLSRTSQVLRSYVASSFRLSSGELTTTEVCDAISKNTEVGPELATDITDFLRSCDLQKFSPAPPQARLGAVPKALAIIDKAESRLVAIRQVSSAESAATDSPNGRARPRTGDRQA